MHVVEHVVYFLSKSTNEADWAVNFTVHDRYGTEIALAIVRSHIKKPFLHPSQREFCAEDHRYDILALAEQAMAANEKPTGDANEKPMGRFFTISRDLY